MLDTKALVTPRIKKSLDFLSNFNFVTKKIEKFSEIWLTDAGYLFDLSNCFHFVIAISTFSTLSLVFFVIN